MSIKLDGVSIEDLIIYYAPEKMFRFFYCDSKTGYKGETVQKASFKSDVFESVIMHGSISPKNAYCFLRQVEYDISDELRDRLWDIISSDLNIVKMISRVTKKDFIKKPIRDGE